GSPISSGSRSGSARVAPTTGSSGPLSGSSQDSAMSGETRYMGLTTRAVAFAIDAALIDIVALLVSVGTALILSLFKVSHDLKTVLLAIAGVAYVLWTIGYFTGFWSVTGETPGNR